VVRVRRLLFPLDERAFTYERYMFLLDALRDESRFVVVPLRDFGGTQDTSRAVIGLRHDVDERLDRAVDFAEIEHGLGLRATYFVLHTAGYWQQPSLVETLLRIQNDCGHEIGWHNDLVTLECVLGRDARRLLGEELVRLRAAGVRIVGTAAHGAPACRRYGYHNGYFFFADEAIDGFPNREQVRGPLGVRQVPHGTLEEFDLVYDAYHLDNGLYYSDATFSAAGKRWHTDEIDLTALTPGTRTIVSTHPDHWDASVFRKLGRFGAKVRAGVRRST
jgi:hypothetical protein